MSKNNDIVEEARQNLGSFWKPGMSHLGSAGNATYPNYYSQGVLFSF